MGQLYSNKDVKKKERKKERRKEGRREREIEGGREGGKEKKEKKETGNTERLLCPGAPQGPGRVQEAKTFLKTQLFNLCCNLDESQLCPFTLLTTSYIKNPFKIHRIQLT